MVQSCSINVVSPVFIASPPGPWPSEVSWVFNEFPPSDLIEVCSCRLDHLRRGVVGAVPRAIRPTPTAAGNPPKRGCYPRVIPIGLDQDRVRLIPCVPVIRPTTSRDSADEVAAWRIRGVPIDGDHRVPSLLRIARAVLSGQIELSTIRSWMSVLPLRRSVIQQQS